jgi:hypothetical protein
MFRDLGLAGVSASVDQPCFTAGERKRLWEYTYLEAGPGAIASGASSPSEFDELASEFATIGTDDTTLVVQPAMVAVAGRAAVGP